MPKPLSPEREAEIRRLASGDHGGLVLSMASMQQGALEVIAALDAERAKTERLTEALTEYDRWGSRMPDAGFTDASPRWQWWHERPYAKARAVLASGEADTDER